MAGLFKYLIIALVLCITYNEFSIMHRQSVFDNGVTHHQPKEVIFQAMGNPKAVYNCATGEKPSQLIYADSLCTENVAEVDAFALCDITFRCPGWDYISFDNGGLAMAKYHFEVPFLGGLGSLAR